MLIGTKTILGIVCSAGFLASVISTFVEISIWGDLQQELNDRLPANQKFEPMFWWFGTYERFWELQQRFLPETPRLSALRRWRQIRAACIVVTFVFTMLYFGPMNSSQ
jgi:hypothetical protein